MSRRKRTSTLPSSAAVTRTATRTMKARGTTLGACYGIIGHTRKHTIKTISHEKRPPARRNARGRSPSHQTQKALSDMLCGKLLKPVTALLSLWKYASVLTSHRHSPAGFGRMVSPKPPPVALLRADGSVSHSYRSERYQCQVKTLYNSADSHAKTESVISRKKF